MSTLEAAEIAQGLWGLEKDDIADPRVLHLGNLVAGRLMAAGEGADITPAAFVSESLLTVNSIRVGEENDEVLGDLSEGEYDELIYGVTELAHESLPVEFAAEVEMRTDEIVDDLTRPSQEVEKYAEVGEEISNINKLFKLVLDNATKQLLLLNWSRLGILPDEVKEKLHAEIYPRIIRSKRKLSGVNVYTNELGKEAGAIVDTPSDRKKKLDKEGRLWVVMEREVVDSEAATYLRNALLILSFAEMKKGSGLGAIPSKSFFRGSEQAQLYQEAYIKMKIYEAARRSLE